MSARIPVIKHKALTILLIPIVDSVGFDDLSTLLTVESDLFISRYGTSASGIWLGTVG
jgi:hypothetical protein